MNFPSTYEEVDRLNRLLERVTGIEDKVRTDWSRVSDWADAQERLNRMEERLARLERVCSGQAA